VWDFAQRTAEWDKREQQKSGSTREKSHVTA
jgi:hypothetical protein